MEQKKVVDAVYRQKQNKGEHGNAEPSGEFSIFVRMSYGDLNTLPDISPTHLKQILIVLAVQEITNMKLRRKATLPTQLENDLAEYVLRMGEAGLTRRDIMSLAFQLRDHQLLMGSAPIGSVNACRPSGWIHQTNIFTRQTYAQLL
ncbi:unnamed protein product [Leptidea sinapis]|uniref:Uncharacterized protein n=1 Tax=Leptidea sinapis TaxID=189913 RepID=A0A5E4PRW5_9NEOP|nr:unnamed protein product [Leptidea sinapis]